jgi:hypothetical protein
MIPNKYILPNAYRGDDYGPISIIVKDEFGNLMQLDNTEAFLRVRNKKNHALALEWSTPNGDAIIDAGNDTLTLLQKPGCFMGMPPGEYPYDLQLVRNGSERFTTLYGTITVMEQVGCVNVCDCNFNGGVAVAVEEKVKLDTIKDSFYISLK